MDLKLQGKLALVTGSTGGIGLEIARSLAMEGACVVINGRSKESVTAAIKDIKFGNPKAQLESCVSDNGTTEGAEKTIKMIPKIDILINNLGIYEAVGFFDETDEDWRHLFEVNVMSGVRLSRHYLKGMIEKNQGRILFIASEAAISPSPEMAHYSATKSMQLSISRSLAELTKGTNVTVNTVMPGSTRTPGVAKLVSDIFPDLSPQEAERRFMRENRPTSLIERLIDPLEIAHFVTYIVSPLSSAVNGAALRIDGGLVRHII